MEKQIVYSITDYHIKNGIGNKFIGSNDIVEQRRLIVENLTTKHIYKTGDYGDFLDIACVRIGLIRKNGELTERGNLFLNEYYNAK